MSHYYATIEGQAQNARTVRGTAKSGIKTAAQSWDGSIIVEMTDEDATVTIGIGRGSTTRIERTLWSGSLADLMQPSVTFDLVTLPPSDRPTL